MINKWPIIFCIVWFIAFAGLYFTLFGGCIGYTETTTLSETTFVNETGKFINTVEMSKVVVFDPTAKFGIDLIYWGVISLIWTWVYIAAYICDRFD